MEFNEIILIVYIAYLIIMSLAAIVFYKNDKKRAEKGKMRIKEKTLLQLSVFGGGLGSEIGRRLARHKTDKIYFSIVIYLSIVAQIAALAVMIGGVL